MAISSTTVLKDAPVHLLPTAVFGPLPFQTHALLLGRSSTTRTGLFILPGIIDADYKGEIKITATHTATSNSLSSANTAAAMKQWELWEHRCSSDLLVQSYWNTTAITHLPNRLKSFTGLVDTGANVSIIVQKEWSPDWPLAPSMAIVSGVGGHQIPWQSAKELHIIGPEGKTATFRCTHDVHLVRTPGPGHFVEVRFTDSMGLDHFNTFLVGTTDEMPLLKLTWLTDKVVWKDQWPLRGEWLHQA